MKLVNLIFFGSIAVLFAMCGDLLEDEYNYSEPVSIDTDISYGNYETRAKPISMSANDSDEVIMHEIRNTQTGMVAARLPLPASWKINGNRLTGPGNTVVLEFSGKGFTGQMLQLANIDLVIEQAVKPYLRSQGGRIVNIVNLPQIARRDQQTQSQYWSVAPTSKTYQVKGVEVKDKNGNPGLLVLHFMRMESGFGTNSFYYAHGMNSTDAYYETAKKALLHGLANLTPDPRAIAQFNQREQQKANQSNRAHNTRMRNNQIAFENRQAIHRDMVNSVNRSSMDTYRHNSAASDRMQQMSVEGIQGTQTMMDPQTGRGYQVEHGYDHYYINGDNEYIGTNDHFYNPEMDPNVDHMNWRKMENNNW